MPKLSPGRLAPAIRIALLFLLALPLAAPAVAEGEPAPQPLAEMETVTVTGQAEDHLTGSNSLDRTVLDHLPARNGSINEAIGILPGVQLGEFSRTSDNAGEILPPSLSVSGGRFYDNNFTIDGLGNNSLLDPAFDDPANVTNVPGHPQEFFINPRFIKTINVYRFNVPARFGSFTGGVVEAETKDPSGTFGGEVYLRHTRDEWTELHYHDSRRDEFDDPRTGEVQPKFDKYDGGISLDIPINADNGLLLGYSRNYSKIPLQLIDSTENQYRDLENYFVKLVSTLGPDTTLKVTGIATPYEADFFLADTLASDYTNENSAYGLITSLEHSTRWGGIEFNLGFRDSENRREAPPNYFIWRSQFSDGSPTSKPWGSAIGSAAARIYSKEGGYGDTEKEQTTSSAGIHLTGAPLLTGPATHILAAGLTYEEAEASFDRPETLTRYTNASTNRNVVCTEGAIDCISNDQFMIFRTVYPADHAETRIRFYDAYLEDTLTWGKVTVRPGLRFSYDDLQHNDNWAPRLAASYDVFGNGRTLLLGGLNRYYGKTLLSRALDEEKAPNYNQTRSTALNVDKTVKDWSKPVVSRILTRYTELKTPYTDEWVVGIEQELFAGVLHLDYVERDSEDEIAMTSVSEGVSPNNYTYSEWTNDGNSQHWEASLSWERLWQNHHLLLTATWQETETTNSNYFQRADSPDVDKDGAVDPVWYHGHIVDREDLPRPDFNREWSATVTYIGRLPWGFTFTNVTRYRSGYTALDDSGENIVVDGERLDIYDEIKQPESWVFDWILEWEKKLWREQALLVSLEINNVFDEKVESGESIDVYDLGRQFWLGMTYKF